MSLQDMLDQYIKVRRSLGYDLQKTAQLLSNFVSFAQSEGAEYISTDLALRWATQPLQVQPATHAARLGMVRRFAIWCSAADSRTEVPADGLLPHKYRRKPPYIYSDEEIENLVKTARQLPSPKGLRGHTYSTFFGLLAVTGMRLSEAVALDRQHIDLKEGILRVQQAKLGKSRFVPVHPSTCDSLTDYAESRDLIVPVRFTHAFFIAERGTRITTWSVRDNFVKVSRQIGLRALDDGSRYGHGPRLHDMRHRFAVRTLLDWYRAGLDIERQLPKLATYLGHTHIRDTYWYLEAVPELLALATDRLINNQPADEKEDMSRDLR